MTAPVIAVETSIRSRATGVAPLYVFFDASGTTDAGTTRPFHDLQYRWSFGDTHAGNWAYGVSTSLPKNGAVGPVAAHIYETPGTYTWTLLVSNGTSSSVRSGSITVDDPNATFSGTNTIVFSTSGNFTGAPSGSNNITTSAFDTAIATYAAPTKRLLFRRGEFFTASAANPVLTANGPGIIGAFGTGAVPRIRSTSVASNSSFLDISSGATPTIKDWRIMDLEFDGQFNANLAGVRGAGGFDQLTFLRMNVHNVVVGFKFAPDDLNALNSSQNNPHHVWDQLAIVDSTIANIGISPGGSGSVGTYLTASQGAFMGNSINDTTLGEHNLRVAYLDRGVISYNTFAGVPASKETVSIRTVSNNGALDSGREYFANLTGTDEYTKKFVFSFNQLSASGYEALSVIPVHQEGAATIENGIAESNYIFYPLGSAGQNGVEIWANLFTARNNVVNMTNLTYHTGFIVQYASGGGTNPSDRVSILHNTIYHGDAGDFNGIILQAGVTNPTVSNNLGRAPLAGGAAMVNDSGATSPTIGNNTSNANVLAQNPLFDSVLTWAGFRPGATSPIKNSGTTSFPATISDAFGCKSKSGNVRLGAFVPKAEAQCKSVP